MPKAFLHAASADGKVPRAYVVKGDIVGLLGAENGWLHVQYVPPTDLAKSVKGWIAGSEATSVAAP